LILGFPAQLRQVFSNLVRNAIEASFTGGRLRVKISAASSDAISIKEPCA
jgi:signal transduction histidine kinase